jgi:hypothetical protein
VFARAADIDLLIIDRVDSTVDALSPLDVEILYAELAEPTAGPVKER